MRFNGILLDIQTPLYLFDHGLEVLPVLLKVGTKTPMY
jgi:hypothetical protein